MTAAPLQGPAAFGAKRRVLHRGFENGAEDPLLGRRYPAEPVQHELPDRGIPHQPLIPQHLQVPGDGGLRDIQQDLQVGHEQRRGPQAIHNPQAGGLRQCGQEVEGRLRWR